MRRDGSGLLRLDPTGGGGSGDRRCPGAGAASAGTSQHPSFLSLFSSLQARGSWVLRGWGGGLENSSQELRERKKKKEKEKRKKEKKKNPRSAGFLHL